MQYVAIDTNVIIYAFDPEAGDRHIRAAEILRLAGNAKVRLPFQALSETYAVLTRRRNWPAPDARDVIQTLMRLLPIIPPTENSLLCAIQLNERYQIPFWDAQMIAVAAEGECSVLLTEDFQDGRRFGANDIAHALRIVNPFLEQNESLLEILGLSS